jgi:putative membrane protein
MKILLSIIFNGIILFIIAYLFWANPEKWLEVWVVVEWGYMTYFIGWVVLWIINLIIRPILKILTLPFYILFLWLTSLVINWIILWCFDFIFNEVLKISEMSYHINWVVNFIIAVAIFTILNMLYSLLFSKK